MTLRDTIADTVLVDNHAHPVESLSESSVTTEFAQVFTEGNLNTRDARHTLNYRAALGVLGEQFEIDPNDEKALLNRRADVELKEYTRDCIAETNTETILVDDGFPDTSPETFQEYTDADVYPMLRLEPVIEELIANHDTFGPFESAFKDRIRSALSDDYVALKSIIAYRRGLNVRNPSREAAQRAYADVRAEWEGRIEHPTLLDYLIHQALKLAGDHNTPLQFHTGFGDPDAHPREVNPTLLAECIQAHPDTPIVLLHAGYPYIGQSGYVTATYPNAYLDLSLAIPFTQHGATRILSTVMELAPTTKLLYGSDAFSTPEMFVLAARRFRSALLEVLESLIGDGIITSAYAETIATNVLRRNAIELYDL